MTYIPTKEDLIQLDFLVTELHSKAWVIMTARYEWNKHIWEQFIIHMSSDGSMSLGNRQTLHPRSLSDLKTLIDIFTPKP